MPLALKNKTFICYNISIMEILKPILIIFFILLGAYIIPRIISYAATKSYLQVKNKHEEEEKNGKEKK